METKDNKLVYYRDEDGKWWILVNSKCNLPVKKETSELMEMSFKAGRDEAWSECCTKLRGEILKFIESHLVPLEQRCTILTRLGN